MHATQRAHLLPLMRVLFDAHQLGRRQTGNETYVRELLGALRGRDELSITAAVEKGQRQTGILAPPVRLVRVPSNGFLRLSALSVLARRTSADILHAIYFLPPAPGCPTVVTIHDICFERHPEFFSRMALIRNRVLLRDATRRATLIVTGSETTRRDLIELWGVAPERVVAIPYGVSPLFRPDTRPRPPVPPDRPLRVLAVGTLQPRKNLPRLLDAMRSVVRTVPAVVRIVGPNGYQAAEIRRRLGGDSFAEIVGYVTDEQLAAEYRDADVFVYPSIYEGFGLPVVEAMASGTAVVTSTGGSLPEVAGDAAIVVDPLDTGAIASAVLRLATEPELRDELRRRGLARAAEFSWSRAAAAHVAAYEEVAARR